MKRIRPNSEESSKDAGMQPNLPYISDDLLLPRDLQNLVDRAMSLQPEQKIQLEKVLRQHHDVFAKDRSSSGKSPWLYFQIDTGDSKPIKQPARPIPLHYKKAVHHTVMKWFELGAIVPSQSPWASPICVPKKNEEVRICVDFRALNAVAKIPAILITRTEELLQRMAGNQFYHAFDLSNAYHNLQSDPKDQAKTATILPDDLCLPMPDFSSSRDFPSFFSRNFPVSYGHWPPCKDVAELRTFLRFIAYYSPFIKNFCIFVLPVLTTSTQKYNCPMVLECQNSFDEFKRLVISAPILQKCQN